MAKPKKAKQAKVKKQESEFRFGPPPSLEELEELEAWIDKIPEKERARISNLTAADGVLTGLALCPPLMPARELFEKYFGGSYLKDDPEAAKMRRIILRRYENIRNQLAKSEILDPYLIFYETKEEQPTAQDGEEAKESKEISEPGKPEAEEFTVEQALDAVSDFTDGFLGTIDTLVRHKNWQNASDDVLTHIVALCPHSWNLFDSDPEAKAEYRKVAKLLKNDFRSYEDVLLELATDIGILGEQLNGWPVNECLDFREFDEEELKDEDDS